jgi:hypothetical protein
VWKWLGDHGLDRLVDAVTDRKEPAFVYIDDRAICFRGDYEETLKQVDTFRTYWDQEKR